MDIIVAKPFQPRCLFVFLFFQTKVKIRCISDKQGNNFHVSVLSALEAVAVKNRDFLTPIAGGLKLRRVLQVL